MTPAPVTRRVHGEALLLTVLVFAAFFAGFFAAYKIGYYRLHLLAADLPLLKSGFDTRGLDTIITIKALAPLAGLALAALLAVVMWLFLVIFSGWRRRSLAAGLVAVFSALAPLAVLLAALYVESPNTALFSGIRAYIVIPALFGLAGTAFAVLLWYGGRRLTGCRRQVAVLLLLPLISGCGFGDLAEIACQFSNDPDHCYQMAAIESGDAAGCEKIAGEGFVGQNPPKDKCYLSVAANTGDYDTCKKIEGGFTSYTQEECEKEVAIATQDKAKCEALNQSGQALDCAALIPAEGDNPLTAGEAAVAKVFQIRGDVRIIKADGRVIPVTKDSVLGPGDTISALEQSSFMIDMDGKKSFCIPQNTMISMNEKNQLDNACAAATGVR